MRVVAQSELGRAYDRPQMRFRRWGLLTLLVVAMAFGTLGMTSPRSVPRLAFLQAPAPKAQVVGCEFWQRHGIVWRALYGYPCDSRPSAAS